VDGAWRSFGVSAEILATIAEKAHGMLKAAPVRIAFSDAPTPTSWALANHYYPRSIDIATQIRKMLGAFGLKSKRSDTCRIVPLDVPDKSFTGPF
jgi:pyruvate dehydrogenase E1 component beta subunit